MQDSNQGRGPTLDATQPQLPDTVGRSVGTSVPFDSAADPRRDAAETRAAALRVPSIPGYEVLSLLGRGGMGIVYEARHLSLNRKVALKMIRAGEGADASEISRFRAEAQAVAQLAHPHIVQVYEVGDHGGMPFISLEFVGGGNLGQQLAATPQPPKKAANLVETLARAIHTAHERGIIHRDLKPANVLLAIDGTPKITDFGLAKDLEMQSGQTKTGDVVGTPSYMAPEQARGDLKRVGALSDVYALGAILYEALTGRPPFKGATVLDTLDLVRSTEPVPPSRLQPKLPVDLETICLKCLEKEPAARYASALELAEELARFLRDEPIVARPVGRAIRAWRWGRRKPVAAALIAAIILLAVGSPIVAFREASLRAAADKARTEADESAATAQTALAAETAANATARKAVREYYTRISSESLLNQPGLQALRQDLMQQASRYFQDLIEFRRGKPEGMEELAEAYFITGLITTEIGSPADAVRQFKDGEKTWLELGRRTALNPGQQHDLAKLQIKMGDAQRLQGAPQESLASYSQGLAALDELHRQSPKDESLRIDIGWALQNVAVLHREQGRAVEAQAACERGRALIEDLLTRQTGPPYPRHLLASLYQTLSLVLLDRGDARHAAAMNERAVDVRQKLAADFPENLDYRFQLARNLLNLGVARDRLGDPDGALEATETAQAILATLASENPLVSEYQIDLAVSYLNMAGPRMQVNGRSDSIECIRQALGICQRLVDKYPDAPLYRLRLGAAHANLSGTTSDPAEAARFGERGRELFRGVMSTHGSSVEVRYGLAVCLSNLGNALTTLNRANEGERAYRESIEEWREAIRLAPAYAMYRGELAAPYHGLRRLYVLQKSLPKLLDSIREERSAMGDAAVALLLDAVALADATNWFPPDASQRNAQQQRDLEHCCREAVSLLGAAVDAGFPASMLGGFVEGADLFGRVLDDPAARRDFDRLTQGAVPSDSQSQELIFGQMSDLMSGLALGNPGNPQLIGGQIYFKGQLGQLSLERGDLLAARRHLNEALAALAKSTAPVVPPDELASLHHRVGEVCYRLGDPRGGTRHFSAELEIRQSLPDKDTVDARDAIALCLNYLGSVARRAEDVAAARDYFQRALSDYRALALAQPEDVRQQTNVASAFFNLGRLELQVLQPIEAANAFREGLAIIEPLEAESKLADMPHCRNWIPEIREYVALCELVPQALQSLEFAVAQPSERGASLLILRAADLARRGQHADASLAAERLRALSARDVEAYYNLACCRARCAESIALQSEPLSEEAQSRRRQYQDQAVESLAQAVKAGYSDFKRILADTDLISLYDVPAFRQLVAELEESQGSQANGVEDAP